MKMTVQCQCSKLTGTLEDVSPQTVNRFVCYCNDCQAFAHFLDREADVLDAHGGTEIMQMAPSHLKFTGGQDHIACMRLSDKGIYRWYSRCCNTPIANTGGFKLPFVGLTHNCVHPSRDADRTRAFGDVRGPMHGRFAKGGLNPGRTPLGLLARFLGVILKGKLRGEQKRSPFFDPETGNAVAQPKILTTAKHTELMERVSLPAVR